MNKFAPQSLQSAGDFIARETKFGAMNYKPLDVVLHRGEGVYVWGRRNALDQPDLIQRFAEPRQGIGADLGDEIPSSVGGVDILHFREAAQRAGHLAGLLAFNRDAHHRADAAGLDFGGGADGETANGARGEHPGNAVLHRTPRGLELFRQRCRRLAGIGAQQCQELAIDLVHHIAIRFWQDARILANSSSLSAFC